MLQHIGEIDDVEVGFLTLETEHSCRLGIEKAFRDNGAQNCEHAAPASAEGSIP